jgi:uncharacterized membrane protein YdjX (TVP38/TMEM64 family)
MGNGLAVPGGGDVDAVEPRAAAERAATAAERRDRALRRIFIGLFALLVICFVITELNPSCMWQKVQDNVGAWRAWAGDHWLAALALFFLVYAAFTALPLPVVTVMCLLAGALFGRTAGTAVASLGYTAGVTVAFLTARGLLRDRVRRRFGGRWLGRVERGFERDGTYYLLTLRLMPSVPYWLVNLLVALTPVRTRTYMLVSWVGVLPMTFLYAGLGTEVATVESPSGLLSLSVIGTLVALALLPLVVRAVIRRMAPAPAELPDA